jgi:hypothetical protein
MHSSSHFSSIRTILTTIVINPAFCTMMMNGIASRLLQLNILLLLGTTFLGSAEGGMCYIGYSIRMCLGPDLLRAS